MSKDRKSKVDDPSLTKPYADANSKKDSHALSSAMPSSQTALMRSWLQKLLVIGLCALSFYAGWRAHESNQIKQCLQSGGKPNFTGRVFGCQWQSPP